MIPFPQPSKSKEAPLYSASFFIWSYYFYPDRIEIFRNFILTRSTVISMDKIEMMVEQSGPFLALVGRCNLILTFAGNIFTLWGIPKTIAECFSARFSQSEAVQSSSIRISTRDLMKKSAMQTKLIWYLLLNIIIWTAVFLMGSRWIPSEAAHALSDLVFEHMLVAGTLVLSLGLPTVLIWFWAFTGGFLMEFLKYYRYTATRKGDLLYFEYGLLIHRRVYLDARRIAIVEYKQSPLMRIFGYGKLDVRAVGHNPLFLKSKPLLPFIRTSNLPHVMATLFPAIEQKPTPSCSRSLFYGFVSWKSVIPFLFAGISLFLGWEWLLAAAVAAILVICSILLEYQNTDFHIDDLQGAQPIVILSKGGFYRTAAWIDRERIEMIAISGSRQKIRKGYVNIRIRVFGKSGTYALIRNVNMHELYPSI